MMDGEHPTYPASTVTLTCVFVNTCRFVNLCVVCVRAFYPRVSVSVTCAGIVLMRRFERVRVIYHTRLAIASWDIASLPKKLNCLALYFAGIKKQIILGIA